MTIRPSQSAERSRALADPAREPAAQRLATIRERLLAWYADNRRALPWRGSRDPYAILVSEVMLQQTQVERVIPKYEEFLRRFPSFEVLAASTRADVIDAWVPLGYNRRAVFLHEIARAVVERGELPDEPAELARLKGLGAYTSAAVGCFAFGKQVPTIDTNVRRVLSRLFADRFTGSGIGARPLEALAREVMPAGRAEDWNQALMDLGATVCSAHSPACERCPVGELCADRLARSAAAYGAPRRAVERRAPYRVEAPFLGSSRYYRGRIVHYLRDLSRGQAASVDEVGAAVRADYGETERAWLLGLLRGLERDGLVRLTPDDAGGPDRLEVALP